MAPGYAHDREAIEAIRYVGVSNFSVSQVEEARSHLSTMGIVVNQVKYNLHDGEIESRLMPYCFKNGY